MIISSTLNRFFKIFNILMFIIWFSIFLDFSFLNHPIFAYSQSIDIADNLKPNMLPNFNDWEWKIASSYDKAGGNSDGKGYLKKEGNKYVLFPK